MESMQQVTSTATFMFSSDVCQVPSTAARANQGRQKINFKDLTRDCYNTFFSAVPGIDQEQKCPFVSDSGSAKSQLEVECRPSGTGPF